MGDLAGEEVVGKGGLFEIGEGGEEMDVASEEIRGEVEGAEGGERGEVGRDGAGEAVSAEVQGLEVGEKGEGRGEDAVEVLGWEIDGDDAVTAAEDAGDGAGVGLREEREAEVREDVAEGLRGGGGDGDGGEEEEEKEESALRFGFHFFDRMEEEGRRRWGTDEE